VSVHCGVVEIYSVFLSPLLALSFFFPSFFLCIIAF
jgi:hypothetical protein